MTSRKEEMDKFKLAIIIDTFSNGGVSKVLADLLKELKPLNWEITLFVRDIHRVRQDLVLDNIRCKPWNGKQSFKESIKTGGIIGCMKLLKNTLMVKLCKWNYGAKKFYLARCNNDLEGEYDCAIGYHMIVNDVSIMTLEKINAKRRILWVHGQKTIRKKDIGMYSRVYSKADEIVCVSEDTEKRWSKMLPKCKSKMSTIHNCYDFDLINNLSDEECDMIVDKGGSYIVTVGGMYEAKGFDRVPKIAQKLLHEGYNFKWYLIGGGPLQESIEEQIQAMSLNEYVYVLGQKSNPYPYIKNCDIYVQPSYTEGYCTSTMEAKILRKPVVTTDVPGMREQFESEVDGLIVESSVDGIYEGIKSLLESKELYNRIVDNLNAASLSNDEEVEKALKVIKG